MTNAPATLDAVDRAFLWHADHARRRSPRPPDDDASVSIRADVEATRPDAADFRDDGMGTIVERLLRVVPEAWGRLARRVEDAHRAGADVIAVTGARRGEGRTTTVECLARALAARGRRVECHDRVPLARPTPDREGGTIVLVDAGVWFPGGPVRRAWLERQSLGCHAVILVRRADQPPCEARGAALEAVGLTVLGEVLTMTPPPTCGIRVS